MERYTKRLNDGQAVMDCQGCPESWRSVPGSGCTALYCRDRLKDRVAAYEDTGLEPQEKGEPAYKLPDHHNSFGEAWWIDGDVPIENISCVFSADKDA